MMAKTIVTQFGEFLNYDNLVKIGVVTNWEDAEIDEESGTIKPDFEMIARIPQATVSRWVSMRHPMKPKLHSKTSTTG